MKTSSKKKNNILTELFKSFGKKYDSIFSKNPKKELTFEIVKEKHFTLIDCVRYYFPNYSTKLCNFILWEKTCFPMNTEQTLKQLYQFYKSYRDDDEFDK